MSATYRHPAATLERGLRPGDSVTALVDVSGVTRRAYVTGEPDTFFSVPARISWHGRKVRGFLCVRTVRGFDTPTSSDPAVYVFIGAPGRENRERAERIVAAVVTDAGEAIGNPGLAAEAQARADRR